MRDPEKDYSGVYLLFVEANLELSPSHKLASSGHDTVSNLKL